MIPNPNLRNDSLLKALNVCAKAYSTFSNKDVMYAFIHKNKEHPPIVFCARYYPENFMHLCGVTCENMSALEFYQKCLNSTIKIEDISLSSNHNFAEISEKVSVLNALLNFKNMKQFVFGEPDIQPPQAYFDFGVGRECFIGYRYNKITTMYTPVTNYTDLLTKFCFNPNRLSLVMSKPISEDKYDTVEFEVTKNIFQKLQSEYLYSLSDFVKDEIIFGEMKRRNELFDIDLEIEEDYPSK